MLHRLASSTTGRNPAPTHAYAGEVLTMCQIDQYRVVRVQPAAAVTELPLRRLDTVAG
jgi:hypothetical protein